MVILTLTIHGNLHIYSYNDFTQLSPKSEFPEGKRSNFITGTEFAR